MNNIHHSCVCVCVCARAHVHLRLRAHAQIRALARARLCVRGHVCFRCMFMYHIHSDSSAIVVDHENHRVQFWDKDGSWSRLIGICVVCCECAVKAIEMYI